MGVFSLITPTIHVHDQDLTGILHKFTAHATSDELDVTTFGSAYKQRIGGLETVDTASEGFWDSVSDAAIFADLGVADRVLTTAMHPGAETNTAYMLQTGRFTYEPWGQIGQPAGFVMTSKNTNAAGMVRGQMAKAKGNVSGTGQLGSILTMTGPSASQYIYVTFHIFTAGTTITIQVQSATTLGFAGPTTRATIGPLTAVGGTWMTRVIGPFTDGFWRLNVSAITGTFNVAAAIGIQ